MNRNSAKAVWATTSGILILLAAFLVMPFVAFADSQHISALPVLDDVVTWLVRVGAIFQTGFTILWATRQWWVTWIGRALMWKSFALMIYLDYAAVAMHLDPFPEQAMVSVVLFTFLTCGIVLQPLILGWEIWSRRGAPHDLNDER